FLPLLFIHSAIQRRGGFSFGPQKYCEQSYPQVVVPSLAAKMLRFVNSIFVCDWNLTNKFHFKMLIRSLDLGLRLETQCVLDFIHSL
ncbi:TPA: hypothetical protein ACN7HQ_003240, partial [Klebsiella pneumoniae]